MNHRVYCGSAEPTDECEAEGFCDYHAGALGDGVDPVEAQAKLEAS